MNLILVTIDCMRRDRVSAYGYRRATTPFLDRLLDGALHCSSAHSASPWTFPSVADLLAQQGYSTAAFGAVWNAHLSIPGRFHAMSMMETSAKRVVGKGL